MVTWQKWLDDLKGLFQLKLFCDFSSSLSLHNYNFILCYRPTIGWVSAWVYMCFKKRHHYGITRDITHLNIWLFFSGTVYDLNIFKCCLIIILCCYFPARKKHGTYILYKLLFLRSPVPWNVGLGCLSGTFSCFLGWTTMEIGMGPRRWQQRWAFCFTADSKDALR